MGHEFGFDFWLTFCKVVSHGNFTVITATWSLKNYYHWNWYDNREILMWKLQKLKQLKPEYIDTSAIMANVSTVMFTVILLSLIENSIQGKIMLKILKLIPVNSEYRRIEASYTNEANGSVIMNITNINLVVIEKEIVRVWLKSEIIHLSFITFVSSTHTFWKHPAKIMRISIQNCLRQVSITVACHPEWDRLSWLELSMVNHRKSTIRNY